jgi:hypothetical protein
MDPVLVVVVTAVMALFGGGLLFIGIRSRRAAQASRAWPSTQGTVASSQVITSGSSRSRWYKAQVTYTFTVDGQNYTSDKVFFGDARSSSMRRNNAWRTATRQARPSSLLQPSTAAGSCARTENGGTTVVYLILGSVLLLLAVFVAVMGLTQ